MLFAGSSFCEHLIRKLKIDSVVKTVKLSLFTNIVVSYEK